MYELSLTDERVETIKKTITNWAKLNLFMSLGEPTKNTVLDRVESGDLPADIGTNDFREEIESIKNRDI